MIAYTAYGYKLITMDSISGSNKTPYCLEIDASVTKENEPVQVWKEKEDTKNNQKWVFEKITSYGAAFSWDKKPSGPPNCYGYAINLSGSSSAVNPGFKTNALLSMTRIVNKTSSAPKLSNDDLVKIRDLVISDLQKLNRTVRVLSSYNDAVRETEYRIALRIGFSHFAYESLNSTQNIYYYDYHFMVQLNDGRWAEKHGTTAQSDSDRHASGKNPNNVSWNLGNITGYYNSNIVFYAISK